MIRKAIDLEKESVAFLQTRAGKWFDATRHALDQAGFSHVDITRQDEWPAEEGNIALSTLHSAKGLEFDHVFILGLNAEMTPHGADADDAQFQTLRRLLAMAIGRARKTVTIGAKQGQESKLLGLFKEGTYEGREL